MEATVNQKMIGRVHIEKHKANGEVTFSSEFDNVFLISGYRSMVRFWTAGVPDGVSPSYGENRRSRLCLYLGTGTTEPSIYDPGLVSRSETLGAKYYINDDKKNDFNSETGTEFDANNWIVGSYTFTYQYGEGQAAGVWSELGLADPRYEYPMTRALIRDESGNPITLTVLADEFLVVKYTIKFVVPKFLEIGNQLINGTDTRIIMGFGEMRYATGHSPGRVVGPDGFTFNYGNSRDYAVINESHIYTSTVSLNESTGLTGSSSSSENTDTTNTTADADGLGITVVSMTNPKTENWNIYGWGPRSSHVYSDFFIKFIPHFVKAADERLTFTVHLRFVPEGYDPALDTGAP